MGLLFGLNAEIASRRTEAMLSEFEPIDAMVHSKTVNTQRWARLLTVSICICGIICMPHPHFCLLGVHECNEQGRPLSEEGESSEEQAVSQCSAHRRLKDRDHNQIDRHPKVACPSRGVTQLTGRPIAIVGHLLANGLCAPLLT